MQFNCTKTTIKLQYRHSKVLVKLCWPPKTPLFRRLNWSSSYCFNYIFNDMQVRSKSIFVRILCCNKNLQQKLNLINYCKSIELCLVMTKGCRYRDGSREYSFSCVTLFLWIYYYYTNLTKVLGTTTIFDRYLVLSRKYNIQDRTIERQ